MKKIAMLISFILMLILGMIAYWMFRPGYGWADLIEVTPVANDMATRKRLNDEFGTSLDPKKRIFAVDYHTKVHSLFPTSWKYLYFDGDSRPGHFQVRTNSIAYPCAMTAFSTGRDTFSFYVELEEGEEIESVIRKLPVYFRPEEHTWQKLPIRFDKAVPIKHQSVPIQCFRSLLCH